MNFWALFSLGLALTPEEFERVKTHPRVGAEILRNVPFGAPVAELVL